MMSHHQLQRSSYTLHWVEMVELESESELELELVWALVVGALAWVLDRCMLDLSQLYSTLQLHSFRTHLRCYRPHTDLMGYSSYNSLSQMEWVV